MDVKIIEEALPVISINFEELKEELSRQLAMYEGMIVTEESLPGCKDAKKELASMRVKVDNYRKDKKKELSEPITAFENQCKELISMIQATEKPLDEGIKVFDDKRREEKKAIALEIIERLVSENELNEKYAAQLTVIDKYMNLTAQKSSVEADLEVRAFALRVEQDREEEKLHILESIISEENKTIREKLNIVDFEYEIDQGRSTSDIISSIKQRADKIRKAEMPAERTEMPAEDVPKVETKERTEEVYRVTFSVCGTATKMRELSAFLNSGGYDYKVQEQIIL